MKEKETKLKKRSIKLPQILDPLYISVVNSPANRVGFKIIRSKKDQETDNKNNLATLNNKKPRLRKAKRSSGLYAIFLPEGITLEYAEEILRQWDLAEDYRIALSGDSYILLNKDLTEEEIDNADLIMFPLNDGMEAGISSHVFNLDAKTSKKEGISVASIEFSSDKFNEEEAKGWMESREISYEGIQHASGNPESFTAIRSVVGTGECSVVNLEEGIKVFCVRSDEDDIPRKIYRQVMTENYGKYGWGHFNFLSALYDPVFSDKSELGLLVLRDVLENIIFFNELPLENRLTLIRNALNQYEEYMTALIQSVPTSVLELFNVESNKETDMSDTSRNRLRQKPEDTEADAVQRSDEDGQEPDTRNASAQESESENTNGTETSNSTEESGQIETLTRADVEEIIKKVVAEALAVTNDTNSTDPTGEEAVNQTDDSNAPDQESNDSDRWDEFFKNMGIFTDKLGESISSLTEEVKSMRSDITTTITRRSEDSHDSNASGGTNVFSGIFGSVGQASATQSK